MSFSVKNTISVLLKYIVPLIITIGLCWLLFKGMDLREMWATMRAECDFRWMWGNLAFCVCAMLSRAARWRIQLKALGIRASLWELTLSVFGTYSVNLVLPRLGEVWRCGFVAQRRRAPFAEVFGSMVADRLADTVCVALITLATFTFAGSGLLSYLNQDGSRADSLVAIASSPLLWGGLALCLGVVVWVFVSHPDNKIVSRIRQIATGLWKGFAVIATMPGKGRWLLYTVGVWTSYILAMWCAFQSFPLTERVIDHYGAQALMLCFVLTSISMAVPSNGGIGPYQWALIFGLGIYAAGIPGLDYAYSAAFANMLMGTQTLFLILLGLFTFGWIALSKKKLEKV
ncbi:MAG: flippase-like domain-containing protein [Duncaniella sp.]|nr:flippase-like domain-containing protein [Duncaniella sp.]